jgi:hypothetical protein
MSLTKLYLGGNNLIYGVLIYLLKYYGICPLVRIGTHSSPSSVPYPNRVDTEC